MNVIFENQHLIVANKPSGMLTEGKVGEDLESWASAKTGREVRCCHRLDRLTSGVVLLRKTRQFNRQLADMFSSRRVRKTYWAIVTGAWPEGLNRMQVNLARDSSGNMKVAGENGLDSMSTFRKLGMTPDGAMSWLEVILKTGRTHQARVHCAQATHPILGDDRYGAGAIEGFFGLHARELRMTHPATGETMIWQAEPPTGWEQYLNQIRT